MRKSIEKKQRSEDTKLSPNKEFLIKFITKNFERQLLSEKRIRGFNFFLQRQISRLNKSNGTVESEIGVTVKLLQNLIANMDESLKNPLIIPYFNDSLYAMIDFIHVSLAYYNNQKVLKAEQWQQIQAVTDLFGYTKKWINMSESDPLELTDKQLVGFSWIDQLPEFDKNYASVMSEVEGLSVLAEWCCIGNLQLNYYQMFRSIVEQYIVSHGNTFTQVIETLIEKALIFKKGTLVDKLVKLLCSLRTLDNLNSENIKQLLQRVFRIDQQQRSSRIYREVLEAIQLQDYLNADELLDTMLTVLRDVSQFCNSEMSKDTHKILCVIAKYSNYFSEIQHFNQEGLQSLYVTMLRVLLRSQQVLPVEIDESALPQNDSQKKQLLLLMEARRRNSNRGEPVESLCSAMTNIFNNIRRNSQLYAAISIKKLSDVLGREQISEHAVQRFVLNTLPDLLQQQPPDVDKSTSNFRLSLYLKMMVRFVNRRERIHETFQKEFRKISNDTEVTNYHFAVCFLLIQALTQPRPTIDIIIANCLAQLRDLHPSRQRLLLANLILIASLTNQKDYPYLKISARDLVKKLLDKPELLSEQYYLPIISSSETFLFAKHTPSYIPDRIQQLTRQLNRNTAKIKGGNLEVFYYILIELNNMCKSVDSTQEETLQRPAELDTIMRMRLCNGSAGHSVQTDYLLKSLESAMRSRNHVEMLHILVRLFCTFENCQSSAPIRPTLQTMLGQIMNQLYTSHTFTYEELMTLYKTRKSNATSLGEFVPFIQYCREMQVVRFYCEAHGYSLDKLFSLQMQVILRLMLKISTMIQGKPHESQLPVMAKMHLMYLPVQSNYLPKTVLDSPLFLVYVKMAIYYSSTPLSQADKPLQEVKQSLENEVDEITTLLCQEQNPIVRTVKFLNFDFLKTLIDRMLVEYSDSRQHKQDPFSFKLLARLIDNSPPIKERVLESMKMHNLQPQKINLVFKRIHYILRTKQYELFQHSKAIYHLLSTLNDSLQNGQFNQYVQAVCQLDLMDDKVHSCHIIRQLIQLKCLIKPNEELANYIFEYIAKLTEFYGEAKKGDLLTLIPRLVCELFGIIAVKSDYKKQLANGLQILERTDKPTSCSNYGTPFSQSVFRCIDCQDKRIICHACVLICHEKHAVVFAASSSYGSKHPCQCSAILCNQCKLKKPPTAPTQITKKQLRDNMMPDFNMFRSRGAAGMGFEIPPSLHTQLNPMNSMNPMSRAPQLQELTGQTFSHPFRFGDYGNPFDPREDIARMERVTRLDRYHIEPEFLEDEEQVSGLFESSNNQIRRMRARLVTNERKEIAQPQQFQPEPEQQIESDQYSELALNQPKIEVEETTNNADIIKGQSFLLQIFLQISQQMCLDRGRKASIFESENWRLNFMAPVLQNLSSLNARLFPQNSFKTRLNNNENQLREISPMICRKPIAVGKTLTLVLSSTTVNVLQNKRILVHLNTKTNLEAINHHGLNFECHSIEFCPNVPTQFCVAGLQNMIVLSINPEDGTISKHPAIAYTNRGEYINKIQYLEVGIMLGDTKSLKLVPSKTPSLVIQGAKDGGLIRDWHVLKLEEDKFIVPTYLAIAITSYSNIYTLQFDENDKGEKQFTNKINVELKKKGPGSAIHLGYMSDGRKYVVFGFKDKEGNNFIGRLEPNLIENVAPLKFNTLHPNFQKSPILGHIVRVSEMGEKMLFCCTLKPQINKDLSINAGQLALFSLCQDEKFAVQPLLHTPNDSKCEGIAVLPIDHQSNAILSLHEDGSLSIFVEGELKKESLLNAIKELDEAQPSRDANSDRIYEEVRKLIADNIRVQMLSQMDALPAIDFRDRSQILKRETDYRVDKDGDELTFLFSNPSKIMTGLVFSQSHKVTLPTRTIDNVLEVGFTALEMMYFYAIGRLTIRLEKLSNGASNKQRRFDRIDRAEFIDELELEAYKKMATGYNTRIPNSGINTEYELYGQNVDNYLSRFRKLRDLLAQPNHDPTTTHIKEIFLILEIFLREIRDTGNSLLQQEQLMNVVEQFKPLLLRVEYSYYDQVKSVIELCLEIVNIMRGEPNPPIGSELEPKTFTLEPLIRELEGQANCAYLLGVLYDMALTNTQRFFFWISKYRQLIKKIYKKYSLLLAKDDKMKGKEHERQVDPAADKLLCLIVASYNILAAKSEHEGETLLNFIRSILAKYGGSKGIRRLFYKYLVYFYDRKPEQWLSSVIPAEEGIVQDFPEQMLEEELIKETEQIQPSQLLYMEMNEQEQLKLALLESEKLLLQQQRFNQPQEMYPIEEEKLDMEQMAEMIPAEAVSDTELKAFDSNLLMRDLFTSCMRAFENEESIDTARYSIVTGYVLFKALDVVNPTSIEAFLARIQKWLKTLKIDRQPSVATLSFLSLFSKIIHKSKFVIQDMQNPDSKYNQIKTLVLQKAREIVSKDPNPNKKNERVSMTTLLRNRTINDTKLSLPHSLLGLLRSPIELDPVILSLKCYWLLPKSHDEYKKERDRVIYQECMLSNDILKMYKRAKKRPETWRQSVNIGWLEDFIADKKQGWTYALELLAIYYDS